MSGHDRRFWNDRSGMCVDAEVTTLVSINMSSYQSTVHYIFSTCFIPIKRNVEED